MWRRLMQWFRKVDERDLSDESSHFAEDASCVMSMPVNLGEWKASLQMAFEAGRQYQRMVDAEDLDRLDADRG